MFRYRLHSPEPLNRAVCRLLASADCRRSRSVWGTKGRRFESGRPDRDLASSWLPSEVLVRFEQSSDDTPANYLQYRF